MSDERREGTYDHRPRMRVSGRFAGEVSGIEFLEGSLEVVEVERDERATRSSALISMMPSTSVTNASAP